MQFPDDLTRVVLIGAGATAVMDLWLLLLVCLKAQVPGFALIGRWVGNMTRGTFAHASIAAAPPVPGELALGWLTHYAVGIAYAGLLVTVQGIAWSQAPSLLPALAFGAGTVVVPLFVMQPAMGSGFAASKTPAPIANCLRSLAHHTVFGAGLYVSAMCLEALAR